MNVTMDKADNVNAIIAITVEENDYKPKVTKELKQVGLRHPERGFRPGHVPMALLQKKYGLEALVDVVNREAVDALSKYIEENKIDVLGEPLLANPEELKFAAGGDFTFKFEIGLAPAINLTIDKSVTIPYYSINVDEEMINSRDEALRKRLGKQVPGDEVDENALVKGSMVEVTEDGSPKEGGITVESTIVSPRYFKSQAQRDLFLGHKTGDSIIFNPAATCNGNASELASMLNLDKEEANTESDFNFTISEILVVKPADHDQEFFDAVLGKDAVKTEEEYNEKLRELIALQLKADSNYRFTIDAQEALKTIAGPLELPEAFLKKWLLRQNKDNNKYTPENIDQKFTEMRPALELQLIKEKSVKQLGVKVEENDVVAEAKALAQQQFAQYGMANVPEDVIERYAKQLAEDKEQRPNLLDRAVDGKLYKAIKDAVTIDGKVVSAAEFNALFETASND